MRSQEGTVAALGPDEGGHRQRGNGMIAYDEAPYIDKLQRAGFDLTGIHYGYWVGSRNTPLRAFFRVVDQSSGRGIRIRQPFSDEV